MVARCDFDLRRPGRGRALGEGESTPLLRLSATTALSDDDSGDSKGPGVRRAIDRRDRVDGRPAFERESRFGLWWAWGVEGWSERCASEGSKGDEIAFDSGCGLEDGVGES